MPLTRSRLDAGAVALIVGLCALWGLQQVAVKAAVAGGVPPVLQAAVRSFVAASLVVAWTAWREGPRTARALFGRDPALAPGVVVALLFATEFALLYPGLSLTSASRGVLFLYTAPFFTALGLHLFLPAERLRARQGVGLAIAFAGVAVAFADGLRGGSGSIRGDLLCLAGAALWGVTTIQIKRSALATAGPARVLLYQIGGSAPLLLATSFALGEWRGLATPSPAAVAAMVYQSVVVAFASYLAWFWLLLRYPAGRVSGFTFLTPVFGIGFGALLLGEPVGPALVAGLVAIGVGLRLLNR